MTEFFLDNSKGLDVISLLVKYYVPLAHINKVIKLFIFKSAAKWEVQSRERILLRNLIRTLSIATPIRNTANSLQI